MTSPGNDSEPVAAAALVSRSAPAAELGGTQSCGGSAAARTPLGFRLGQRTRDSGPVTAWGMAGSPGLVSGAAEPRTAAPPSTAAASPKAAPWGARAARKPPRPGAAHRADVARHLVGGDHGPAVAVDDVPDHRG